MVEWVGWLVGYWVGWLVGGGWVGGWVDGGEHCKKKTLSELFQTQVSLTPSVFIQDMTHLITVLKFSGFLHILHTFA